MGIFIIKLANNIITDLMRDMALQLIGIDGRMVWRKHAAARQSVAVPTGLCAEGMYLLRVKSPRGVAVGRIVAGN